MHVAELEDVPLAQVDRPRVGAREILRLVKDAVQDGVEALVLVQLLLQLQDVGDCRDRVGKVFHLFHGSSTRRRIPPALFT